MKSKSISKSILQLGSGGLEALEDVVELHGQHDLTLHFQLPGHVELLSCITLNSQLEKAQFWFVCVRTVCLACCQGNKIIVLQGEDDVSLLVALAADDLALLLNIDGESLLLAFAVLEDELEDAVDLAT